MSGPAWFALGVMVGALICPGVPIAYKLTHHQPVI
jgi:hypothetical protein